MTIPWMGCSSLFALCLIAACGLAPCSAFTLMQEGDVEKVVDQVNDLTRLPKKIDPLTEPPCSYCVDQNSKGIVESNDVVLAWIRGNHNGGAFPLRHFIVAPRVINDTYGLFFYDPSGGFVTAFEKDYGFRFAGWQRGVMVVEGPDGTLWSALSGTAIAGPKKGSRLKRVPNLLTQWGHWLMLHPESTAYDLFDGNRYPVSELSWEAESLAVEGMGEVDSRLDAMTSVLGVELGKSRVAFPLKGLQPRQVFQAEIDAHEVVVFWYGRTESAVAFSPVVDEKKLTFYADGISPETAPFKDRQTGTRWTLAGRGVDGPLRGRELEWIPSVRCRWYAWVAENPGTSIFGNADVVPNK